jgi:hypothetical protein
MRAEDALDHIQEMTKLNPSIPTRLIGDLEHMQGIAHVVHFNHARVVDADCRGSRPLR